MKNSQLVIQLMYLERDKYIINLAQEAAKKLKEIVKIVEDVDNRDYIYYFKRLNIYK